MARSSLRPNLNYLRLSRSNPEPVLDADYRDLHKSKQAKRDARDANRINFRLRRIKQQLKKGAVNSKLYEQLQDALQNSDVQTEFECFLYALDCDKTNILADSKSLEQAANLYVRNRKIPHKTSTRQCQALIDRKFSVSRATGKFTKDKLKDIVTKAGLSGLTIRDSGGDLLLANSAGEICLIKVLHLRNQGSKQTNHINNILTWLNTAPLTTNISCAFADGIHSNADITDSNIDSALTAQHDSFWLNTTGFRTFIKDFA